MSTPAYIPAGPARTEIRVVNSRFIATIAPAATVDEAKARIAEVRAEMPDASHHVYAYVIGHGATTTLGMSDDGEPSGTAGRPVLAIVRGSGLGDVVVVVTRYFGGTLLGTGGLVRAYGDAARAVLELVVREEKVERETLRFTIEYAQFDSARRLVEQYGGTIDDEQFAAAVTLQVTLARSQGQAFRAALREATAGQVQLPGE
ncbi:MAG TPA: YigZ family protein [Roseiflexaceae bacterium]|nr:YigZ family protein [Roseiflexaceae bacterium]